MGLEGRNIVCLSTHYWDERWFRKQHFMDRFRGANRVLFVEPTFSMARRSSEEHRGIATNRPLRTLVESRGNDLTLMKPPRGLPKWSDPRVAKLTFRWYGREVARVMAKIGFTDAVLWIYDPRFGPGADLIPHSTMVFDMCDDHAAYPYEPAYQSYIEDCVQGLLTQTDLLVATAAPLLERYGDRVERSVLVPNGFDATLYTDDAINQRPAALAGVPGQILGFVGTLFEFLDFELLLEVSRVHHDKTLVLVGPVDPRVQDSVDRLAERPNVLLAGPQPRESIAGFLGAFDVCLNPFLPGRAADSVSPLKVFEYLAAGRPVVSGPMRALEMEPVARQVVFAADAATYCRRIEECIAADGPDQVAARRADVDPYSWQRLFERVDAACEEVAFDYAPAP